MNVVNSDDFDEKVLTCDSPAVALFGAEWCPFCRSFSEIMRKQLSNISWPVFAVQLNDEDDKLWDRFSIEVIPTLAVFEGGEMIFRLDGILGVGLKEPDIMRLRNYIDSRRT